MKGIQGFVECATYKTTSGNEVYGCANPDVFQEKGCYEITFYTKAGKPYANLDTCSGEKPYAPPEPPLGHFTYWEPPDKPSTGNQPAWDDHEWHQCLNDSGGWKQYCGLKDVPKPYACAVYYDTAYGTVRGCIDQREIWNMNDRSLLCNDKLHLYDEAGRKIGTVDNCPKVRSTNCGKNQCGAAVPPDWACRKERWNFGKLYSGERRTMTRCVDPLYDEYVKSEIQPCKPKDERPLGVLIDERGTRVEVQTCNDGGSDGDLGAWAGLEAEEAADTLNGPDKPSASSSSSRTAPATKALKRKGPIGAAIELIFSPLDNEDEPRAASQPASESNSDQIPRKADVYAVPNPSSANPKVSLHADREAEHARGKPEETWGIAEEAESVVAKSPTDDGESRLSPEKINSKNKNAGPSSTSGSVLTKTRLPGAMKTNPEESLGPVNKDRHNEKLVGESRPAIPNGAQEAAASVANIATIDGWIGTLIPFASLGAAAGAYIVRKRFLG